MTKRAHNPREVAEIVAIQALSFVAGEPERLGLFLAESGIGPETLRSAASDPQFLVSVLDFVLRDDETVKAFAAANDDRSVGQLRIVALLHGGVERVAIDMGQRQRGQGMMAHQPRRAAGAASPRREIEVIKAVAAKAARSVRCWHVRNHGTSRSQFSPSAWRAAAMLVG